MLALTETGTPPTEIVTAPFRTKLPAVRLALVDERSRLVDCPPLAAPATEAVLLFVDDEEAEELEVVDDEDGEEGEVDEDEALLSFAFIDVLVGTSHR